MKHGGRRWPRHHLGSVGLQSSCWIADAAGIEGDGTMATIVLAASRPVFGVLPFVDPALRASTVQIFVSASLFLLCCFAIPVRLSPARINELSVTLRGPRLVMRRIMLVWILPLCIASILASATLLFMANAHSLQQYPPVAPSILLYLLNGQVPAFCAFAVAGNLFLGSLFWGQLASRLRDGALVRPIAVSAAYVVGILLLVESCGKLRLGRWLAAYGASNFGGGKALAYVSNRDIREAAIAWILAIAICCGAAADFWKKYRAAEKAIFEPMPK